MMMPSIPDMICFFFILFGLLFLMLSTVIKNRILKKEKACTSQTKAVVTEVNREMNLSAGTDSYYSWFPVFTYTVNGEEVVVRSIIGSEKKKFDVGQEVELFYNPANVREYYVPQENELVVTVVFNAVGGVFVALGIVFYLLWRVFC